MLPSVLVRLVNSISPVFVIAMLLWTAAMNDVGSAEPITSVGLSTEKKISPDQNLVAPDLATQVLVNQTSADQGSADVGSSDAVTSDLGTVAASPVADGVFAQIDWYQSGTYALFAIVLAFLLTATLTSTVLTRRGGIESTILRRFRHKLQVWWLMVAIFAIGFLLGRIGVVVLFGLVSFWALREFITMTPTRRGDHRTLFWVFFIFTPLQYLFVALGNHPPDWAGGEGVDYYDYYSIMIPVYASLFIPARAAIAGDHKRFLERSAKIQSGLLVCVYSLSYAPALLDLDLQDTSGRSWDGSTVTLLIFFVLIAQLATVFERLWGRLAGRTVIAKKINASRTWEGFLGSMVTTGLVSAALAWATPFLTWEAGVLGAVVAVMALAGTLTMSAIKRDRGVTDTGTLVQGHSGVLDQIDNVCFAAPVFYHITRFFWSA